MHIRIVTLQTADDGVFNPRGEEKVLNLLCLWRFLKEMPIRLVGDAAHTCQEPTSLGSPWWEYWPLPAAFRWLRLINYQSDNCGSKPPY